MFWDSLPHRRRPRGPVKRESATYVGCGRGAKTVRDLFSRPSVSSATYRAGYSLFSTRRRPAGRRCLKPSTRRCDGDDVASMAREANAKGPRRSGAETHGKRCFRRYWKSRTAPAWAGATVARRHRLPSSYRYKRAALGRDDDAAAAMRPVQRPRVRRADRAPLMFVDCISVASVVVEAASRPRHLRAWQMQKAVAAYPSYASSSRGDH